MVGRLSVPPGWTTAAPAMRLAAVALPTTSLCAAPEVFPGSSGSLLSQLALASMAGRAISGPGGTRLRELVGPSARGCAAAPTPGSPGGSSAEIAHEIREFTELLGKLGALRDSGFLTEEEFDQQKQRLLSH
jgi:PPE-SVP subfamily C-terminal region/Short C-terminal domain